MSGDAQRDASAQEVAFCERVLAKGGQSVLTETLRGHAELSTWTKYPDGEVFDPDSGAQWFYHSHARDEDEAFSASSEHGHFHCFVRPVGPDGPIHHLCAVGVDAHGRLLRLFTVNHWVVGDTWLGADATIALLDRFDVHMPQPSYLVNRWLTGVLSAHRPIIVDLIGQRDRRIATYKSPDGTDPKACRGLEVTAEHRF
ncbi:MAG: hypothetical protein AAF739_08190 [Pseudomonadota bacterium]